MSHGSSASALHRIVRRVLAVAVAAVLLTAAACSSQPADTTKRLAVGASAEPAAMDITTSPSAAGPQLMLYNVYETLVRMDGEGKMRPLLAQSWDITTDGLTYTFHLNPAAKFASGTKVTGDAVVKSMDKIRNGTATTAVLKAQMAVIATVAAPDPETVVFTLSQPSQNWLYYMTSTAGIVFDPDSVAQAETKSAGSGPYQWTTWNRGSSVVLTKNANYWGTPPRFDEVTFRYFADANAMNAAMLAGDLDIVSNVQAPEALSQFSDTTKYTVLDGTTNGEVVMGLNHTSPALQSLAVRKAITQAIDRAALLKTVWAGKGQLIGSMAVPTDPYYVDLANAVPYDVGAAKQALADSGVEVPTLRIRVPNLAYATKSAQFVASALKEVGIETTIEELPFPNTWLEQVYKNGDYDITIVAHVEPRDINKFADPAYYWHYNNPNFQALMKQADNEPSEDAWIADMQTAQKMLSDDCAAVWLFMLPNLIVTKATVEGVTANAVTLAFDLTGVTRR